jgi:IS4 transposase
MILRELVERFERETPFCVMLRATLENVLADERINAIFDATAQRQRTEELYFSSVADIMGSVACRLHPSVHAAYQARIAEIGVTVKAVYDKLQRTEPGVSRAIVRDTAERMAAIISRTGGTLPELLPGYDVRILDGNHLRRTERRIGELRGLNSAPLPGHALVVLDPRLHLARDVFPCEDGHAQERRLLPQVLETVKQRQLWIADRNFCTTGFLFGIISRQAYFAIRQHAQSLRYELVGKRKRVAATDTGIVYEETMRIYDEDGNNKKIRRITVELYEPTRDGDAEIHILTNLPKKVTAVRIAELYRKRWRIETAFQELAQNLHGEVVTLGYPKAALFAFCMALLAYNVYSVMQAAMRAAHGSEKIENEFSLYYLADEISHTYRGLAVALPSSYWKKHYAQLTPAHLARELVRIARTVYLPRYRKHKRGPKKETKKFNKRHRGHVSTARVLAKRRSSSVKVRTC